MRCLPLALGLTLLAPALARADAFDYYVNPVLVKAPWMLSNV